jgi:hypothetical protein
MSDCACWFCGAEVGAARAEAESVIAPRSAQDGGPFRTLTCRACRAPCGALRNRRGEWMLYPLEGRAEPSLLERLVPRTSREHLERARQWWLLHADDVERFRAARRTAPRPRTESPPPPPPRRPRGARPGAAPPRPRRRETPGPRAVLGVGADATLKDVQRAWRAAVKRWHPDRIPTKDPVVLAEAERRFRELHDAYEALVAELRR